MLEKSTNGRPEFHRTGRHRAEHWYRDNTIYFITARCKSRFPAFQTESAKSIFWDRFELYTEKFDFKPIVVSLLNNHYHILGYLKFRQNLAPFMKHLHGSVAKLVNDTLPDRLLPFWRERGKQNYMDGCIRDEEQFRKTFAYVRDQCRKHRIWPDPSTYPHTRIHVDCERARKRAIELNAFLPEVPYKRYDDRGK